MAVEQRMLEEKALTDPVMMEFYQMVGDDLDIHSMKELCARAKKLMKKIVTTMKNCPSAQKMMHILMKMHALGESEKELQDVDPEFWMEAWDRSLKKRAHDVFGDMLI